MKTIDVRVGWESGGVLNGCHIAGALHSMYANDNFTVTELPPPRGEDEGSSCCERCRSNDGHCAHYKIGLHRCLYFTPAAPVAPAVDEQQYRILGPNEIIQEGDEYLNQFCGWIKTGDAFRHITPNEEGMKYRRKIAPVAHAAKNTWDCPYCGEKNEIQNEYCRGCREAKPNLLRCPSCEKLRAENARLKDILDNLNIQAVRDIAKGWVSIPEVEWDAVNWDEVLKPESALNQPKVEW